MRRLPGVRGRRKIAETVNRAGKSAPNAMLDDRYLTAIQASVRTGIPKNTLARWRTDGKGPRFVKRGGRILYAAKDLEAWQVDEASKQAAARAWGLL